MNKDRALARVLARIIPSELARRLGVSRQAVHHWTRVPPQHARAIERLTGIPREELRPDCFGSAATKPYTGPHTTIEAHRHVPTPGERGREQRERRLRGVERELLKHA